MKFIENHRALMIAGTLVLTFSCGCVAGTMGIQNVIESGVASAAEQQSAQKQENMDSNAVSQIDEETLAKLSLENADYYLENMPDAPLLKENVDPETADYGGSSLEVDVNDVNATNKAGDIIRKLCKENGIDVSKAKVKDLTREQIAQIDMETFRQSEHGK